jgi:hypothetical protein
MQIELHDGLSPNSDRRRRPALRKEELFLACDSCLLPANSVRP